MEKGEVDKTKLEEPEKAQEESKEESEPEIQPTEAAEESGQVPPEKPDRREDSQKGSLNGVEESEWEDDEEPDMELINDLALATDSNAGEWFGLATPSNGVPSLFAVNRPMGISDDEEDGDSSGGSWEWDGVQEESEVPPIDQSYR